MRVLVTGGAGFIGSHVAARMVADGHEVRIFDNFTTGRRSNLDAVGDAELVEGDMRSYERASTAVRDCEVVLHQGAMPSVPRSINDPLTSYDVNVGGTLNILLAARDAGVRRVVYASSSSIYGAVDALPKHEALPTLPLSPYAVAKQAAEAYCRTFNTVYGLETVALRYFNVFGPRQDPNSQYSAVIPKFITALLEGRSPCVHGDGEQSRDFTFVDNVVGANVLAMDAPGAAGHVMNIAWGGRTTLNELLRELRELTGSDAETQYVDARPGDVRHSHADTSLARELIGYNPQIDLREGLRRTVEHYSELTSLGVPAAG